MKWWFGLITISCFFLLSGLETSTLKAPEPIVVAKQVYQLVNRYRNEVGLNSLKVQKELSNIAYDHARKMAAGEVPFSHDGFDERVRAVRAYAKVDYRVAENLYATLRTVSVAQDAMRDWLKSPGHKKNIHGKFLFTGIGVARSANGEYFITQLFVGKRP